MGADTEEEGGKSESGSGQEEFSAKLLELARKMRMNTDTRRNIFCLLMSSEDYLDCVEKLVKLGTRNQMEREVVFVVADCCIQETSFNPYYGHIASKLGSLDRKYRLAMTFCIWDRIKQVSELERKVCLLYYLYVEHYSVENYEEFPNTKPGKALAVPYTGEGPVDQSAESHRIRR